MKYLRLLSRLEGACLLIAEDKLRLITEKVTLPIFLGDAEAVEHLPANSLQAYRPDHRGAASAASPTSIGVIEVFDSLVAKSASAASGMTSYQSISAQIDSAVAQGFSQIVFNIDSPGGEASGLFSLTDKIRKLSDKGIKTTAFVDGTACSAAYGIFAACSETFATETSILGSIGVLLVHVDTSERDKTEGKTYTIFRSKAEKALGDSHSPLTEQASNKIQNLLDTMDAAFNNDISASRGLSVEQITALNGSEYMAKAAQNLGLVDTIVSGFDEALKLTVSSKPTLKGGRMTLEEALAKTVMLEAENVTLQNKISELTALAASGSETLVSAALDAQKAEFTTLLSTAPVLRMGTETVANILAESPSIASALTTMKLVAKFSGAESKISGSADLQSTLALSTEEQSEASRVSDVLAAYRKATGGK